MQLLPDRDGNRSSSTATGCGDDGVGELDPDASRQLRGEHRPCRRTIWAGRLIVFFGAAHTVGALTAEGASRHAGAWFSRELWGQDLDSMSPAMSAYWLSINSFGPPLIVIGLTVLWMSRRSITPPRVIAWSLGGWAVIDPLLSGPGIGQGLIIIVASGLLLAGGGGRRPDLSTERLEVDR